MLHQLTEGQPVTLEFVRRVFDLGAWLPPRSYLLFAQFFSMFEEVAFRGVFLTMLLAALPPRRAIAYSALAFGIMHLPAVFFGHALVLTLGQVVWASLFGLFYGYLFLKTGSLFPAMIVHWLSNVFQVPLTGFSDTVSPVTAALYRRGVRVWPGRAPAPAVRPGLLRQVGAPLSPSRAATCYFPSSSPSRVNPTSK